MIQSLCYRNDTESRLQLLLPGHRLKKNHDTERKSIHHATPGSVQTE